MIRPETVQPDNDAHTLAACWRERGSEECTPVASSTDSLISAMTCRFFAERGSCKFGDECKFSHDDADVAKFLRAKKSSGRTVCRFFAESGSCTHDTLCRFSHDSADVVAYLRDQRGKKGAKSAASSSQSKPASSTPKCFNCKRPFKSGDAGHACGECRKLFCDDCIEKKDVSGSKRCPRHVTNCDGCGDKLRGKAFRRCADCRDWLCTNGCAVYYTYSPVLCRDCAEGY